MLKKCKLLLFFILGCSLAYAAEEKRFVEHISMNAEGPTKVGHLIVGQDHPINQTTYIYFKLAIEQFKEDNVSFILLELDTPGGEVLSALQCAHLLQQIDTKDHIPVVASIKHWALSAGAMLAYSSRFILINDTSSMGAAEPVVGSSEGQMHTASEKINSALRAEFANLSRFYDRDPAIAQAMVDKDLFVVWREGKGVLLDEEKQMRRGDNILVKKGKLLTLTAEDLLRFGIANGKAGEEDLFSAPFFNGMKEIELIEYNNWKVAFFTFLAHPAIASLLMIGLLLGIYLEANHPGLIFPAILAGICLVLILLSSFAAQAVNWLEVIILFSGILLLLIELFVLPGFGVTGLVGILFTVIGLFTLLVPIQFELSGMHLAMGEILHRLAWLSSSLLIALAGMVLISRFSISRFGLLRHLSLQTVQEKEVYEMPSPGSLGFSVTPLKPSGKVSIQDIIYDVVSEGEYIEKGLQIAVARSEGSKLIVRRV